MFINEYGDKNNPLVLLPASMMISGEELYPEAAQTMEGRKYGFNIKSQLLKLFVIFPAVSALAAWICTLF